jgi:hypothetical protein
LLQLTLLTADSPQHSEFMKLAYEQSKEHGPEARKFTVIFDMDNFSMKQYAYKPAAELVINVVQMYSNNYPEILKYCYIINGEVFFLLTSASTNWDHIELTFDNRFQRPKFSRSASTL